MRNETTPRRGYPLPVAGNKLDTDCEKLRQAIFAIDEDYTKLVSAWNVFHDLADEYLERIDNRQGEFDESTAHALEQLRNDIAVSIGEFTRQRNEFIGQLGVDNEALLTGMRQDVDEQIFRLSSLVPHYNDLVGETFDADSTLPGCEECPLEYIHGLGFYRYDAANTSPADGELVVMGEGGVGRWVLVLPSLDYVFAVLKKACVDLELLGKYRSDELREAIDGAHITGEAVLTIGSMTAHTSKTLAIAVAGARVGDFVSVIPPSTLAAGIVFAGYVSEDDAVTIRVTNTTASSITPAAASWTAVVLKEGSE